MSNYPCDKQGYCNRVLEFSLVSNCVHRAHLLEAYFEHVSLLNIWPNRNSLFSLVVFLPTRFVMFLFSYFYFSNFLFSAL